MTLDERARAALRDLAAEPSRSVDEALDGVIKRGKRKRALRHGGHAMTILAMVSIALAGVLAINDAPSPTAGFGGPPSGSVGRYCGRYTGSRAAGAVISSSGTTLAIDSYSQIVVCDRTSHFVIQRGSGTDRRNNDVSNRRIDCCWTRDGFSVSSDGSRLVFDSFLRLLPDDTDDRKDIYLMDVPSRQLRLVKLLPQDRDVFAPSISSDGSRLTFFVPTGELGKDEVRYEYDFATRRSRRLADGEPPGEPGSDPDGFSAAVQERDGDFQRDLVDPEFRASATILIRDGSGRVVRRVAIPRQPAGTMTVDVKAHVSAEGSRLVYSVTRHQVIPLPDGKLIRRVDENFVPGQHDGLWIDDTQYEIGEQTFTSLAYWHDLRSGRRQQLQIPAGWYDAVVIDATSDLSTVLLTARIDSERPYRRTSDLLIYEPGRGTYVASWNPPWWVRFEKPALLTIAGLLSLLGMLAWFALAAYEVRYEEKPRLIGATALLVPAAWLAWARVLNEGQPWVVLVIFALAVVAVELMRPGRFSWLPFRVRITGD